MTDIFIYVFRRLQHHLLLNLQTIIVMSYAFFLSSIIFDVILSCGSFYVLLPIFGRESILFKSNFLNGDFDGIALSEAA